MDEIWRAVAAGVAFVLLGAGLGVCWLWLGRCMDRAFFGAGGGSVPDPDPERRAFTLGYSDPDVDARAVSLVLARSDGDRDRDAGTDRAERGDAGSVAVATGAVGSGSAAAAERGVTDQRMGPGMNLPLHRTAATFGMVCATCDGSGCLDCTDPA